MMFGAGDREVREDLKVLGGHFMTAFDLFPKYPCFLFVLRLPVV